MPDLLIELFSEEIPARMQARARADLRKLVTDGLVEAGLTYAHAAAFSTPRRLTLAIEGLSERSRDQREERKGPRADAPEKAVEGFLRATGLTRDQLETRDTGKGAILFAVIDRPGRPAPEIVAEVLSRTIRAFPWPKSMRWGTGSLRWVRPLHSILCILTTEAGAEVVPLEIDGIKASDTTEGHRFMAPGRLRVTSFEDYAARLKRAFVLLDPAEREAQIRHDAGQMAFAAGLELVPDPGLLTEVAGLVEWPVVLMGEIGAEYLALPPEVLQTSMKEHQKFFSVRNPATGRIERFITVANRETADHGATILQGNGKVLAARLSDARFFWENDLRTVRTEGMEGMARGLAQVTFHNKLGSQADRVARIEALAREIAPLVGAKPDLAAEAARICKADLQSEMVGEFPELQGLMGRYYAEAAGHDDGVPEACELHYKPLGPSDAVPVAPVSVAVALADKIDTLTGFWAIDEKPTGSKDPFALRRAALGVIRLVLDNGVRLRLGKLIEARLVSLNAILLDDYDIHNAIGFQLAGEEIDPESKLQKSELAEKIFDRLALTRRFVNEFVDEYSNTMMIAPMEALVDVVKFLVWEPRDREISAVEMLQEFSAEEEKGAHYFSSNEIRRFTRIRELIQETAADLLAFFHDRLKVHLKDEGIRHDVIDAVLAMPGSDDLTLVVKRAEALSAFLKSDDGTNLLQGFKRANNILTQAEEKDGVEYSYGAEPKFAETPEEKALFAALDRAEADIEPAMKSEDFAAAMSAMADLRAPIDAFFEAVQINTENQTIRRNRLNLLHRIRAICLSVADLAKLEG